MSDDEFLGMDTRISPDGAPVLNGRRCKPGWYWVLYRLDNELTVGRLVDHGHGRGIFWWLDRVSQALPVTGGDVVVHSGPIAHPYDGRWSGCIHDPAFRRGKRCLYCGTFDISPGQGE